MDVARELTDVPVLGVCLGHQTLAAAAGAAVVRAPEPVHGRLSALAHSGHALFEGIPSGAAAGFDVVRCSAAALALCYVSYAASPSSVRQLCRLALAAALQRLYAICPVHDLSHAIQPPPPPPKGTTP